MLTVQTDDLRQDVRVPPIGLATRRGMPLPIAGDLDRVDREHLVPRRDQGLHPRTSVGLDADHHVTGIVIIAESVCDQGVQGLDPGDALGQVPARQHLPVLVHDLDIVMGLGPVIPNEQHAHLPPVEHGEPARNLAAT